MPRVNLIFQCITFPLVLILPVAIAIAPHLHSQTSSGREPTRLDGAESRSESMNGGDDYAQRQKVKAGNVDVDGERVAKCIGRGFN